MGFKDVLLRENDDSDWINGKKAAKELHVCTKGYVTDPMGQKLSTASIGENPTKSERDAAIKKFVEKNPTITKTVVTEEGIVKTKVIDISNGTVKYEDSFGMARFSYQQSENFARGYPSKLRETIADMTYQLGETKMATFKNALGAAKAGDVNTFADEIVNSAWAQQTPRRALDAITQLRGQRGVDPEKLNKTLDRLQAKIEASSASAKSKNELRAEAENLRLGTTPQSTGTVPTGASYTIKYGDTLSQIAKDHGVSVGEIAKLNAISDPNKIQAGRDLKLPSKSKTESTGSGRAEAERLRPDTTHQSNTHIGAAGAKTGPAEARTTPTGSSCTIKSGDTLSQIAKDHGVSVDEIAKLNAISDPNKIQAGRDLKLPSESKTELPRSSAGYDSGGGDSGGCGESGCYACGGVGGGYDSGGDSGGCGDSGCGACGDSGGGYDSGGGSGGCGDSGCGACGDSGGGYDSGGDSGGCGDSGCGACGDSGGGYDSGGDSGGGGNDSCDAGGYDSGGYDGGGCDDGDCDDDE